MWKIGFFLLIFQCTTLTVLAQSEGAYPPVTVQATEIRVEDLLQEISKQSGFNFSFNSRSIDVEQVITVSYQQTSLQEVLNDVAQKLKISYRIIDDQIILKRKKEAKSEIEEYLTLSGFIEDEATGESLIGATTLVPGTSLGAITNEFGYYVLPLKKDKYTLDYSYVGYEKRALEVELQKDTKRNVAMQPTAIDLPDVIVGLPTLDRLQKKQLGQLELRPEDLNNMPEFGGESGLIKGLQSLPGIQMHSDGSAFFYTRGGERDQNLIIIDDAPIYNPSHLFGFYSIVIPDFAKSIQVYKSDVPTNLGDRLSSIISIRTKDGNLNRFKFSGALNPLINRFSFEIPTVKKKGSIFLSWRRSNFEWLYQRNNPDADLSFGDFNFKWNHKLNDKNRLFLTAILSADNFTNRRGIGGSEAGIRWANLAATLRWNHVFSPKLFSNTILYTGSYGYRLFFPPNFWQSALGTLSLKSDFTHYTSPTITSKFGFESQAYFIDPGGFALDSTVAILPKITPNYSRKFVLYYQGVFKLSEKLQLNAGLRMINWANRGPATYYRYDDRFEVQDTVNTGEGIYNSYLNLDPRLSLQYQVDKSSQLKLSFGIYHQYLQLISNATSPFNSFEVWLPASPNIKPQSSAQVELSYLKYFEKPKIEISAALYYKKLDNQIDYEDHATILLNPQLEGELRFGSMQAYGLELLLKKDFGRLSGWMGYTYSRAMRQTAALNGGRTYPAFQDRPHDFSAMLNYELSKRTLFSAYWTSFSGSTFSSPTGFYTFNDQTIPVFAEKNNDRLPSYERFDFAFKFRLNKDLTRRFQHSLTFSVYNAFAHKNVVAVNFNRIPVDNARPVVKTDLLSNVPLSPSQIDLIRFFPSLTYKFEL